MTKTDNINDPHPQIHTYEDIAWRPETYTVYDAFTTETPEQALAMAKQAFNDESGESCLTCAAWDEFSVTLNGQEVLCEVDDQTAEAVPETKQNASHTPGQWYMNSDVVQTDEGHQCWHVSNGANGGLLVATCPHQHGAGKANARLIAASPRVLKALINLAATTRTFRNVPHEEQAWTSLDDDAINEAFAAKAEAEGRAEA